MRVAIVEDDPLLLEGLKLFLNGETGIIVSGTFRSLEESMPALKQARPEVMLVSLGLPGRSAGELIREIKKETTGTELIAHISLEDWDNIFSALRAGASGYIFKGSNPRDLVEVIHGIHNGEASMSPKIARKVMQEFEAESIGECFLIPREKEIIISIEEGYTCKQIAERLMISSHAVQKHIKKIYEKLQAKSREVESFLHA